MKRRYRTVAVAAASGGWIVTLDGKPMTAPGGQPLVLPGAALAAAVAAEWRAQADRIRPLTMPLTRLAATAIDRVRPDRAATVAAVAAYGGTDLLCHRAAAPPALAERQEAGWGPLLAWLQESHGIVLVPTSAVRPRKQDPDALSRLNQCLAGFDDFALTAVQALAAATGSVVVALAAAAGKIDADAAFAASQLDELYQAERWGGDAEAEQRRAAIAADIAATVRFLRLLHA